MESYEATAVMSRPSSKFVESLQDFANDETNYMAEVERAKLKKTKSEKEKIEDVVGRLALGWKDRMSQMSASKVNQDTIDEIEPIKSRSSINTPISIPTTPAKRKKLHGRLRNSNSKSTVTTRDTSFSETRKTERKKLKRHKSLDTISVFRGAQSRKRASGSSLRARESKQTTSKDIYELYQNSASKRESALLQASIESSRISTAASAAMTAARNSPRNASAAMGYRAKRAARAAAKAIYEDKIQDRDIVVELHRECEGDDEEDQSSMTRVGAPAERFEEGDNIEMHEEPIEQTNCCAMHSINDGCEEHDHPVIEVYPPVENTVIGAGDTRRETKYDQPTESSKMKQVQRPYRFHVSHIPFVVGTSLSPSHNLGLNIQQVLSLIKVKQPAIPSISPMLIRKVSKGIRPLSSLFEYINGQYGPRPSRCSVNFPIGSDGEHQVRSSSLDVRRAFSSFSCTDQTRTAPKSVPSTTNQSSFKQNLQNINCEPLYEEDEESVYSDAQTGLQSGKVKSLESSSKWESKSFVSNRQSRESHRSKLQATLGDTQETIPQNSDNPDNHEQFIEVFSRLYDQYSMMLAKLDKINGQLETKRNDKLLQREADELQDATNAKCQEVEAMIKLYKEVMSLKQQMRQLHERNSFVCITEDGATSRPFYSDSRQDWSQTRNRSMSEAPNALRLAGLLKQIQAFQRQLALV
ncbi:hypothetical protein QAD02_004888 [Eretmocerus hayati]|uniref:Uncharacterized protein n=1 Tax=Eretmocerus hayati TaxID=131215 RepID=A0ACC2NR72_9HYME|nr:hypothetical protein QAD02_004888 [Eretmocerus hayati]